MFRFSSNGKWSLIICFDWHWIWFSCIDSISFGTTNCASSSFSLASVNNYPIKPCICLMHNRTQLQQHWVYLHLQFPLLQLSPLVNCNLPEFHLQLGTLEPRFHLLAVLGPDPNGDFTVCNTTSTNIMTTMAVLQLIDNIKRSTSLDWQELWNALASTPTCIIVCDLKTPPGNYFSGITTDKSLFLQNKLLHSQRLVVPLRAITANSQ